MKNPYAGRRQPCGVWAVFANGNRREMTGLGAAQARRQYAFWLTYCESAGLIYDEGK